MRPPVTRTFIGRDGSLLAQGGARRFTGAPPESRPVLCMLVRRPDSDLVREFDEGFPCTPLRDLGEHPLDHDRPEAEVVRDRPNAASFG